MSDEPKLGREVIAWRALATIAALKPTKATEKRILAAMRRNAFGLSAVDSGELQALIREAQDLATIAGWVS